MATIYTIGHSTRPIGEFIDLLKSHRITQLVDIRTIPKSRHNPQYEQKMLSDALRAQEIKYVYIKELGGLRPAVKHSVNDAWRNKSFQNYADYMQSDEFEQGIAELLKHTAGQTSAIMCAEAVPWRCHRSLVADALMVHEVAVCEIIGSNNTREHTLTSFAVVNGSRITYPKSALPVEIKNET